MNGGENMRDIKDLSDSYLLEQGIVILTGPVDRVSAQVVVCQMQYLASKYPERPIQFWINSPGGDVTAGLAIYDVMNYVNTEVHTVAIGMAASMAAILLSSGTRGKRFALPNAEVLIHQPAGGVQGQTTDVINAAKHMEKIRAAINAILAGNTGRTTEQIAADTDRDYIMSAAEAKEYGLIDGVIRTTPQTERRPTDA